MKNSICNTNIKNDDVDLKTGINYIDEVFSKYKDDILEFSEGKSLYQIEKFTALDEGASPVHQYKFVLVQLRYSLHEARRMYLGIQKKLRKIKRYKEVQSGSLLMKSKLKLTEEEVMDIDLTIEEVENGLCLDILSYKSKIEETKGYEKVLDFMKKKYGKEKLNKETLQEMEPHYWSERLSRQALFDNLAQKYGINSGNLWAIERAVRAPVIDGSNNVSEININDFNEIKKLAKGKKTLEEFQQIPLPETKKIR